MAPRAGTEEGYAIQMGELWSALTRTLSHLDEFSVDPKRLDDEAAAEDLRRLQYRLHTAGERVYGLSPPAGSAAAHSELSAALAGAPGATAEGAAALADA